MKYKNFKEYFKKIINTVGNSGVSNGWSAIKIEYENKLTGTISADPLKFSNGNTLRFTERSKIENGVLITISYSFHFEKANDNYYFRYEKAPKQAKPIVHEECHLHVNAKEPRFKTHSSNFIEVFNFIVACF